MEARGIGRIAYSKPLARCGMEELAARQRGIRPDAGVLFARKADGDEKSAARQLVLDLFQLERWPGRLHMLTMPSVQWRFERLLLGAREVGWMRTAKPRTTYFTACENDRSIYYASVAQMPGLHTPNASLKRTRPFSFAEQGVKSRYASFFFANIDDLMAYEDWTAWDAVWLDYTGPLTVERLPLIQNFFHRHVRHILIVTALRARWNEKTSKAIARAGGHRQWLRNHLDGEVLHDIEYQDTSPMAQIAIRKQYWRSPLV